MEKNFVDIIRGMRVEKDCILSPGGDVTVAFELLPREQFTSSDSDLEALHQTLIKALKVLPNNTVYHQQDSFFEAGYEADYSKPLSFLSHSSERFFNERPALQHQCHIFITLKASDKKVITGSSALLRKHIVPDAVMKEQQLQEFFNACGQLQRIINDSGFASVNTFLRSIRSGATQCGSAR